MLALLLYLGFSGLASLYAISALFGLVQGGIVPSYAIVIREYLPAREAGMRFGVVIMATLFGHGVRRLDLGRDLRCHRLVQRGVRQRRVVEPVQRLYCSDLADTWRAARGAGLIRRSKRW